MRNAVVRKVISILPQGGGLRAVAKEGGKATARRFAVDQQADGSASIRRRVRASKHHGQRLTVMPSRDNLGRLDGKARRPTPAAVRKRLGDVGRGRPRRPSSRGVALVPRYSGRCRLVTTAERERASLPARPTETRCHGIRKPNRRVGFGRRLGRWVAGPRNLSGVCGFGLIRGAFR